MSQPVLNERLRVFLHALLFVLGFSLVFVIGWGDNGFKTVDLGRKVAGRAATVKTLFCISPWVSRVTDSTPGRRVRM